MRQAILPLVLLPKPSKDIVIMSLMLLGGTRRWISSSFFREVLSSLFLIGTTYEHLHIKAKNYRIMMYRRKANALFKQIMLPPRLCITRHKPKRTKRALQAKLLHQRSFLIPQLLELQHKQHGWEIDRMQQNRQVFQDPNL